MLDFLKRHKCGKTKPDRVVELEGDEDDSENSVPLCCQCHWQSSPRFSLREQLPTRTKISTSNTGGNFFGESSADIDLAAPLRELRDGRVVRPTDVFIAIMGATGSGKSSFISLLCNSKAKVGHGLSASDAGGSGITKVEAHTFELSPEKTVHLIDTPGFDDTAISHFDELKDIVDWLSAAYNHNIRLHGIIYLHCITDSRSDFTEIMSMTQMLCGENSSTKAIMASTMWDTAPRHEAEAREEQLIDNLQRQGLTMDRGSKMYRHYNTFESAMKIVRVLADGDGQVSLDPQPQMVDEVPRLDGTKTGKTLNNREHALAVPNRLHAPGYKHEERPSRLPPSESSHSPAVSSTRLIRGTKESYERTISTKLETSPNSTVNSLHKDDVIGQSGFGVKANDYEATRSVEDYVLSISNPHNMKPPVTKLVQIDPDTVNCIGEPPRGSLHHEAAILSPELKLLPVLAETRDTLLPRFARDSTIQSPTESSSFASSSAQHPLSFENLDQSDSGIESDASSESETSCNSSAGSSSLPSRSGTLRIEDRKKLLLDHLMQFFFSVISPSLSSSPPEERTSGHDGGTRHMAENEVSAGGASDQRSVSRIKGKRRLSDDQGDDYSGGGEGHKRVNLNGSEEEEVLRLGCPYFKNSPHRYCTSRWRSCPGPGWSSVHRVKEHLYRCHHLPITCPRCHEQFDTVVLRDSHLVADERCQVRDRPQLDGFDENQEKSLRSRKKGSKHMSEAEKWRDVYLILFPNTEPSEIPSPYLDFRNSGSHVEDESSFTRYEHFLRRELPKKVRHELEARIDQALEPLEETLKSQIVDIVRDAQLSLFQSFVSNNPDKNGKKPDRKDAESGLMPEEYVQPSSSRDQGECNDLQAYRPEPYLMDGLVEFDGLLFDLIPDTVVCSGEEAGGCLETTYFGGIPNFGQEVTDMNDQSSGQSNWDSGYVSFLSDSQVVARGGSRTEEGDVDKGKGVADFQF